MERGLTMSREERVVAVISPWDNLRALVNKGFRVQSLPRERKVFVWREDLNDEKRLVKAVKEAEIEVIEVRRRRGRMKDEW